MRFIGNGQPDGVVWRDQTGTGPALERRVDDPTWQLGGVGGDASMHNDWRPGGGSLSFLTSGQKLTWRRGSDLTVLKDFTDSATANASPSDAFPFLSHQSWAPSGDLIVVDTPVYPECGTSTARDAYCDGLGGRLVVVRPATSEAR